MHDLIVIEELKPSDVFENSGAETIVARIEKEARAALIDVSTDAGRKECASVAYKIARSKTYLDDMGKNLVADWKAKSSKVDGERKKIRDRLDALKEEIRKPLTDFENAETTRVQDHEDRIAAIVAITDFSGLQPSSKDIQARLEHLSGQMQRDWQEFGRRATEVADAARANLQGQLEGRQKYEADQAELVRLREEQAKREQTEREERIRKEASEAAERQAQKAIADAKASEEAAKQAAEQAKADAEKREREAEERAKKAAEESARREEQAKDDAARKERERIANEQREADAAASRREADKKHRAKINNEALSALADATELTPDQCKSVIEAIAKGLVPHVGIRY